MLAIRGDMSLHLPSSGGELDITASEQSGTEVSLLLQRQLLRIGHAIWGCHHQSASDEYGHFAMRTASHGVCGVTCEQDHNRGAIVSFSPPPFFLFFFFGNCVYFFGVFVWGD